MRYWVLAEMDMKMRAFWDTAPCNLVQACFTASTVRAMARRPDCGGTLKRQSTYSRKHGWTSQKAVIFCSKSANDRYLIRNDYKYENTTAPSVVCSRAAGLFYIQQSWLANEQTRDSKEWLQVTRKPFMSCPVMILAGGNRVHLIVGVRQKEVQGN